MDKMYLRKKDIVEALGMARGTVSDWLVEYSMFVPVVRHGNVTYYKPESLDVLRAIKEIKEAGYLFKPDIVPQLIKRGFAVTAEEVVDDIQRAFNQPDTRDGMVKVVAELALQDERLELLEARADSHSERMDGHDGRIKSVEQKQDEQDGRIDETTGRVADLQRTVEELGRQLETMEDIKRQLAEAQKQIAAANEPKSFFKRLFGR